MIPEGTAIRLRELQSRPELNGEAGVVVGPPAANGRYPVRLSSGTALSAKPENLLSHDTQGGFDFDSIFEKALELELLSESEFDAITDAVAQGATTEGELLEVWIERVLDGARLHRPKLECNVGVLRDGSRMIVGLDPDDFDSTREGGYAEDELLGIGRPADFASLELYAEIHLPGDGATPLCTEANARIAAGVKKALAAQGVWGASQADQVHPIAAAAKALQPIAIAMFLGRPEWLSRDELLLAARSGFVIPAKPMLEFRKVTSWRLLHLLPLLKAALEPTGHPADSYAVALQWLRARLAAHFGPLLLLEAMHAALAKGETLEQAVRRVKLIIPGTKPDSKPPPALRRVVAGAARDDGAAGARLALGFDVALGLEEDVALGLEEADALDLEVVLPTLALDAAIAKGVWSGTDGAPVHLPWPEIATLADDAAVPMLSYEPGGAAAATARALPDLHLMQAVEVGLGTMRKGCLALSGRPPPASAAPRAPRPADVLSRQLSGRRAPRSATESIGMARYESRGEAGVARAAAPDGDQTGACLSLGCKEDWAWLGELQAHYFVTGTPLDGVGGALNQRMSDAIKRALSQQPAWADAPALVREAQALLVSLFLEQPPWLSRDDLNLAMRLGLAKTEGGSLTFNSLLGRSELFPLLKCALEPTTDPVANYELGVRWLRAQQTDPERPTASIVDVLRAEAMHDSVVRGCTLKAAAERSELIGRNKTIFKVVSNDETRGGIEGILLELLFAGREDLTVPEVFVPGEVFAHHFAREGSLEAAMSASRLAENGFAMGIRE